MNTTVCMPAQSRPAQAWQALMMSALPAPPSQQGPVLAFPPLATTHWERCASLSYQVPFQNLWKACHLPMH